VKEEDEEETKMSVGLIPKNLQPYLPYVIGGVGILLLLKMNKPRGRFA